MNTIKIKKSDLAKYKGLGKTHDEVAAIYGVEKKEIFDLMVKFNLSKARKPVKEYEIEAIDDVSVPNEEIKHESMNA